MPGRIGQWTALTRRREDRCRPPYIYYRTLGYNTCGWDYRVGLLYTIGCLLVAKGAFVLALGLFILLVGMGMEMDFEIFTLYLIYSLLWFGIGILMVNWARRRQRRPRRHRARRRRFM